MSKKIAQVSRKRTWFGRCIFIGWFCERGSCKFCYRSTTSHKKKHAVKSRRSMSSMIADAVIGKNLGWKFEYLTGGYANWDIDRIAEIAKNISEVYGEKIWVNLGVLDEEAMDKLSPYVGGICASIETVEKELHDKICPDKPIKPYSEMLYLAKKKGFNTSMTIVIGLGEKKEHVELLFDFIKEHKLDRITFYALKPVKGTAFEGKESPEVEDYSWWIRKVREEFPKIEVIAGLTPKKVDYVKEILEAGATAITKFPAVRLFGSAKAEMIEKQASEAGFEFVGTLTKLPDIDWDKEVDKLRIDEEIKQKIKQKLQLYLARMRS
ncbi:radical SAM protein [Candidatus Woesearchaeota archaeon]|nr:radical SAM protein [Candidatus Woesearchaeota archaeon]